MELESAEVSSIFLFCSDDPMLNKLNTKIQYSPLLF